MADVKCPYCGSRSKRRGYSSEGKQLYRCKEVACGKNFTDWTVGHLARIEKFIGLRMGGIPLADAAKEAGITLPTGRKYF